MPKTKIQCEEIREHMKKRIMDSALIYFARNGFDGTRISDLARFIGIGQGTLYSYFSSKEELFGAIMNLAVYSDEQSLLKLKNAPISPAEKIMILSDRMVEAIKGDSQAAYVFVLNMRFSIERGIDNSYTKEYEAKPNHLLAEIIMEGQKDKSVVQGDPIGLADLYWSMVHIIAVKKVFNDHHEFIRTEWLARLLLKDEIIDWGTHDGK